MKYDSDTTAVTEISGRSETVPRLIEIVFATAGIERDPCGAFTFKPCELSIKGGGTAPLIPRV